MKAPRGLRLVFFHTLGTTDCGKYVTILTFPAIEKSYDSVQPKEGDFIKVIEDDLRYINFSMNELSQNQTNPSRKSELMDAYNRLENWLSDYKQSLV